MKIKELQDWLEKLSDHLVRKQTGENEDDDQYYDELVWEVNSVIEV